MSIEAKRQHGVGSGSGALAASAGAKQRGEIVARLGIEQRVLGERARRDEAHDVAAHDRLGAALARFGRIFELLGDGDAVARP